MQSPVVAYAEYGTMNTDATNGGPHGQEPPLETNAIFELLLAERRRRTLRHLFRSVGAVTLAEVAEAVALEEGRPTRDRFERICTGLHHAHLPKLIDAGVVRYDPVAETIELTPRAAELERYLDLAAER